MTITHDMGTTDLEFLRANPRPRPSLPLRCPPTVFSTTATAVATFTQIQMLAAKVPVDAATEAASAAFEAKFEGEQKCAPPRTTRDEAAITVCLCLLSLGSS